MGPLSLKTIALLEVLKDESKFCHLPLGYRNICYRIKEYWNNVLWRKNRVIGCRQWYEDIIHYILFINLERGAFSPKLDVIDQDILNWCYQCYSITDFSDPDHEDYMEDLWSNL